MISAHSVLSRLVRVVALTAVPLSLSAMTADDLVQRLAQPQPPRVVDVRATQDFEAGHIPGAMNIPFVILPHRHLPPLGEVVVVADGRGVVDANAAAALLRAQSGISADVLEGGFAAWESAQRATTRRAGLSPENLPAVTYNQLLAGKESEVVLVDLRPATASAQATVQSDAKTSAATASTTAATAASAPDPLATLAGKIHGARVSGDAFAASAQVTAASKLAVSAQVQASANTAVPPLLVLIDNNDGRAQEVARRLIAAGNRRFVILAGGMEAVRLEGKSLVERNGGAISVGGGSSR